MAGEWDTVVQQWLVDPGSCYAGGIANKADCVYYAAAPVAGEEGWGHIYADDHTIQQLQEDGETTVPVNVNEAALLLQCVEQGRVSGGIWVGKKNFKCVQQEDNVELEAGSVNWRFCAISEPKGGAHIVATGSTVVVGLYQEDKQQSSGNCKNAVMAFAEYLLGAGY
jgi:profilin-like protein